ncbi:hypothetical protein TruAng_008842 [Truncatella angustata]|nr:hypothetical protein TruAng_008842 [Truncatella angustata]
MTAARESETNLLTEYFEYASVSLLDDIINSVNILAERAINAVEKHLPHLPPASLVGVKNYNVKDEDSTAEENTGSFSFLHQMVAQLKDASTDKRLSATTAFTLSHITGSPHAIYVATYHIAASCISRFLFRDLSWAKNGEVKDGEWQGEGRELGKSEVEGLEMVISMPGGEAGASSSRGNDEMMAKS